MEHCAPPLLPTQPPSHPLEAQGATPPDLPRAPRGPASLPTGCEGSALLQHTGMQSLSARAATKAARRSLHTGACPERVLRWRGAAAPARPPAQLPRPRIAWEPPCNVQLRAPCGRWGARARRGASRARARRVRAPAGVGLPAHPARRRAAAPPAALRADRPWPSPPQPCSGARGPGGGGGPQEVQRGPVQLRDRPHDRPVEAVQERVLREARVQGCRQGLEGVERPARRREGERRARGAGERAARRPRARATHQPPPPSPDAAAPPPPIAPHPTPPPCRCPSSTWASR